MPCTALLEDRKGNSWQVKVVQMEAQFCFVGGWDKFVKENDIQRGDVLVFQYDGKLTFSFIRLGLNSLEKPVTVISKGEEEEDDVDDEDFTDHQDDLDDEYDPELSENAEINESDAEEEETLDEEDVEITYQSDHVDQEEIIDDEDSTEQDEDGRDDDEYDSDLSDGEKKKIIGTSGGCIILYGRRNYRDVHAEENAIFASGQVERPKSNAYFVAKISNCLRDLVSVTLIYT